jgi:hypothetical protein
MLWRMLGADHPMEAHKLDSRMIHAMGSSADAYEGVQSFLAKRPAKFTMRVSADLPQPYPWWPERRFADAPSRGAAAKRAKTSTKPRRSRSKAKAKPVRKPGRRK